MRYEKKKGKPEKGTRTRRWHRSSRKHQHRSWRACSRGGLDSDNPERISTYPEASHDVVDVVAVYGGTRANACTEAKLVVRDEASPFVVLDAPAKGVAINEASDYNPTINDSTIIQFNTGLLPGFPLPIDQAPIARQRYRRIDENREHAISTTVI